MKQERKIFYKALYVLLFLVILYNFIFLSTTIITKREYIKVFGISFIPMKGLVIARDRSIRKNTAR